MRKNKIVSIICLFVIVISLISCEKRTGRSFLHNETDKGVTVEYGFKPWDETSTTVYVAAGEEVEIPDIDRWGIVHPTNSDSVVFLFEDSVRIVQYYEKVVDSAGLGYETYSPEINNIMADFLSPNPSWIEKNTSGNKWRNDYYIRR